MSTWLSGIFLLKIEIKWEKLPSRIAHRDGRSFSFAYHHAPPRIAFFFYENEMGKCHKEVAFFLKTFSCNSSWTWIHRFRVHTQSGNRERGSMKYEGFLPRWDWFPFVLRFGPVLVERGFKGRKNYFSCHWKKKDWKGKGCLAWRLTLNFILSFSTSDYIRDGDRWKDGSTVWAPLNPSFAYFSFIPF